MPTDKLGDALGMIITQITTLGTGTDVFFWVAINKFYTFDNRKLLWAFDFIDSKGYENENYLIR